MFFSVILEWQPLWILQLLGKTLYMVNAEWILAYKQADHLERCWANANCSFLHNVYLTQIRHEGIGLKKSLIYIYISWIRAPKERTGFEANFT